MRVEVVSASADATLLLGEVGAMAAQSIGGISLVDLTPPQIGALARLGGISQIRMPVDLRDGLLGASAPSRGPHWGRNNIPDGWSQYDSAGVKIGIIDIFDPVLLATELASGEIQPIPAAQRKCFALGGECPFGAPGYQHGNAVTEIIADGAPEATLYLAEVATLTDYQLAIDWFAANGVVMVNHSATGPFDGPGDGTGPSAAVIDYAV
jgi:hypothetical protein